MPGGGGHSTLIWTGVPLGGENPDPVWNRSAHQKYTLGCHKSWTPRRQAFAFSGGPLYFFPFKGLLDNATL